MTLPAPVVAIGGENLIDRVQTGARNGVPVFANNPGGSPFNVAIAAARQGANVHYLSPISTDAMGDLLVARMDEAGVSMGSSRRREPTTMATVTLKDGVPSYDFRRANTAERAVTVQSIRAAMPRHPAALHIGSLALAGGADAEAWASAFVTAHEGGVFTSLDPNIRPALIAEPAAYRARLGTLFRAADLIKLSDEDLAWLYPDTPLSSALDRLRGATDAALVILTKGADGAVGLTQHHRVVVAAHRVVTLRDSIGAGDTFMGTLLAQLAASNSLSGHTLGALDVPAITALLERAALAAALNCEKEGCNPPARSDIDAAVTQGNPNR